ncbi:MAG: hypothetical protein NW220_18985 [Leptolyngbyaceae cyanobacterium bins.349]|nr:hypothetical protein [Leptolyngbyaceae cyanobacterium bins.349]
MKEWTFLLQKDGDRSWLPLDSTDVEILEGRYRIVVQTNSPNTDINIRICHLATEEDPPKRRIQKRSSRTNDNGLMVLTPFTPLQAGNWEFSCFATDPLSDLVGDTVHHAVRLRVAACLENEDAEWEQGDTDNAVSVGSWDAEVHPIESTVPLISPTNSELSSNHSELNSTARDLAALNVEIAQALGFSMDRLVEMTDQLSHQLIEEIFREFSLSATAETGEVAPSPAIAAETVPVPEVQPAAAIPDCIATETASPLAMEAAAAIDPLPVDINQVQIVLAQDGWMATKGESLAIAGRIEPIPHRSEVATLQPESNPLEPDLAGAIPQEIQIHLRDPQTSQILFHACQSFPPGTLPLPFHFLCKLPDELTTHLLLGEVIIAGVLPGAETVLVTLKTFNFTVTIDPQGLVEELQKVKMALAETASRDALPDMVAQFSERLEQEKARQGLDLSFLNMAAPVTTEDAKWGAVSPAETAVPQAAIASRKQILPPQLYQPEAEQAGKRKLELPQFASIGARSGASSVASSPATAPLAMMDEIMVDETMMDETASMFANAESDLEALLMATNGSERGDRGSTARILHDPDAGTTVGIPAEAIAATDELPSASATTENDPQLPSPPSLQEDLAMIDELSSPIRSAFQALNLQDKFLHRLSAMAADTELTTLLKLTLPASEAIVTSDVTEATTKATTEATVAPATGSVVTEIMAEPETTEVLVDDDPSWREWLKRAGSRTKPMESIAEDLAPNPLVLPADQPIPMPMLELGVDEIVSGQPINVRIKLPQLMPKIYVKLWVNDRQTRTLLDGPRWLVDFLPNGFDQLEASTQITAPFGSLEIRLEAIAVEMQTQRESQKVSLDCEVIPSTLPDDLFDEFEY